MSTELMGQTLLYMGGAMIALTAIIGPVAYFVYRRIKKRLDDTLDEAYGPRKRR